MANPATQDDGLIILSDDSISQSGSVLKENPSTSSPTENLIDFSLDSSIPSSSSNSSPVTISRPSSLPAETLDFSFDLWSEIPKKDGDLRLVDESTWKDTGLEEPKIPAWDQDSVTIDEAVDMDAILDDTIVQLNQRKTIITQVKTKKNAHIADLLRQIEELQKQVADLQKDVVGLEDEGKKIDTNIASLDEMKTQ